MKKFFRRLKPAPSPPSSNSSYTTLPLQESPLVHQLTSPRHLLPQQTTPLPSSTLLIADEVPELICVSCAGSQFPDLLAWKPGDPRPWVSLAHVLDGAEDGEPGCPYCAFFRALIGGGAQNGREEGAKFAPYLRIRRAFERLGVGERHELGGETLVEVMGRNKRLPWGYVVRATDEEDGRGSQGYLSEEKVIRGRLITPMLSVDLVRSWLDYCEEHHTDANKGCLRRRSLPKGLRLIDVRQRKVVNADDVEGIVPDYVTLSYVWGQDGRWEEGLTAESTLPVDTPPLISNALDFTLALGFEYLWVDRYCHITLPAETQKTHLDYMGDIFAQSSLTLIVASGTSVADGIPGLSRPRDSQLSLKTETGLFTTTLLRPDLAVGSSTWQGRGWTYQEGLLARRRLVFTNTQAYFQCQTLHCHESIVVPLKYAPGLNLGRVFPETGPGEDMKSCIKTYISKDFNKPEDRLDAFRGILQHFKADVEKPMDSVLGLPLLNVGAWHSDNVVSRTDRLAVALGWAPSSSRSSEVPPTPYALSKETPFPSWTWLSWRLREGHTPTFTFALTPSESSCQTFAPPNMEVSIGLADSTLHSWEADGEVIRARAEENIRFLRLKSYTFGVVARKAGEAIVVGGDVITGRGTRESIKTWVKAAAAMDGLEDGEYDLTGVVLCGKNWKGAGEKEVVVMICNEEGWSEKADEEHEHTQQENVQDKENKEESEQTKEEDKQDSSENQDAGETAPETDRLQGLRRLNRLGVLTLPYLDFTTVDDTAAVLEGIELDKGDRGDMKVELREVDIY